MKKVLIISKVHTHPIAMGNSYAIVAQAEALKKLGCEVHLLYVQTIQRGAKAEQSAKNVINKMQEYWGDYLHVYALSKWERMRENLLYKYRTKYCNWHQGLYDLYPSGIEPVVTSLQQKLCFDICIVNYVNMTKIFNHVKFPKMACFTHDTFAYKNLHAGKYNMWLDANQEAIGLQKCTDVLAIQDEEMNYFKILAPNSRHYSVYTPYQYCEQPVTGNHNILFLSGRNQYNKNGLEWFVNKVFPLITSRYPDCRLLIAGGICKEIDKYKDHQHIRLIGYVDDVAEFYKLGDIAINPTFQGTGLKIKTFESLSYSKITIVHPHSKAGIFDKDNAPLFSSDKPADWVDFLDEIWDTNYNITDYKQKIKEYLCNMNSFIDKEYSRLVD